MELLYFGRSVEKFGGTFLTPVRHYVSKKPISMVGIGIASHSISVENPTIPSKPQGRESATT
jgi:hypothetical protein